MKPGLFKILAIPFSLIFYLLFGILLLLFDPIQRICLNVFGYEAHKRSVTIFNGLLLVALHVTGTVFKFEKPFELPLKKPVIIVSNHQSMWDIPPLIWFLRKIHPKFISKIELGKGIPTVSYNLRKGGSVLIDRKNPVQSTEAIKNGAIYISENNRSLVIFAEGTRSRNGMPKPFKKKGLLTLFENAPEAFVLPVSINHSWKLQRFGMFPIPLFNQLKFYVHPAIKVSDYTDKELLIQKIEQTVVSKIEVTT